MQGVEGTGYVPYVPDQVRIPQEYSSIVGDEAPTPGADLTLSQVILCELTDRQTSSMSMLDMERREAARGVRSWIHLNVRPSVWNNMGRNLTDCVRSLFRDSGERK